MATERDISKPYRGIKDNKIRDKFDRIGLDSLKKEQLRGGETVAPAQLTAVAREPSVLTAQAFNFHIQRQRQFERLALPSVDQLIDSARRELKAAFRRDFEVPQPPTELFETLQNFAKHRITRFDETYYLPGLQLEKGDELWKWREREKPNDYFWRGIGFGIFPAVVARLEEGWYIGERRGKPNAYDQQGYGENDYMGKVMQYLRVVTNRIYMRGGRVPLDSRFGASAEQIEEVILPEFAKISEACGIVRNRRYIEFNVRGIMAHPEWGKTNTQEWFGDPIFEGTRRLVGGCSYGGGGGLGQVADRFVWDSDVSTGFSPVAYFPSKPR